jgi:hypothetical protein
VAASRSSNGHECAAEGAPTLLLLKGGDLLRRERLTRLWDDEGHDGLAHEGVGHAHDGDATADLALLAGFELGAGDPPVASVNPYTTRASMPSPRSLSRIFRMISTGTGAAPMEPVRSDPRSYRPKSGWPRMAMNIVGTPEKIVTRSCSISRMASAGSKTSITTWVDPARQLAATPPIDPNMWK